MNITNFLKPLLTYIHQGHLYQLYIKQYSSNQYYINWNIIVLQISQIRRVIQPNQANRPYYRTD